jgi:hypothetical protein
MSLSGIRFYINRPITFRTRPFQKISEFVSILLKNTFIQILKNQIYSLIHNNQRKGEKNQHLIGFSGKKSRADFFRQMSLAVASSPRGRYDGARQSSVGCVALN